MNRTTVEPVTERYTDGPWVDDALADAVRETLLDHQRAGNPVATWKDGKVVLIPPEEIVIPDEEEIEPSPAARSESRI